eukprot:TRINITY_DN2072_c0_g1_i1.p1 TRINITY_DN2072_c0_g1~~TRINITY_DN2072_c0_g1_i1.p1  ORF type:complete len:377 (+),score=86.60 TRINITY_DN2072_c0_g1_i1:984-2114(+)
MLEPTPLRTSAGSLGKLETVEAPSADVVKKSIEDTESKVELPVLAPMLADGDEMLSDIGEDDGLADSFVEGVKPIKLQKNIDYLSDTENADHEEPKSHEPPAPKTPPPPPHPTGTTPPRPATDQIPPVELPVIIDKKADNRGDDLVDVLESLESIAVDSPISDKVKATATEESAILSAKAATPVIKSNEINDKAIMPVNSKAPSKKVAQKKGQKRKRGPSAKKPKAKKQKTSKASKVKGKKSTKGRSKSRAKSKPRGKAKAKTKAKAKPRAKSKSKPRAKSTARGKSKAKKPRKKAPTKKRKSKSEPRAKLRDKSKSKARAKSEIRTKPSKRPRERSKSKTRVDKIREMENYAWNHRRSPSEFRARSQRVGFGSDT